ncbi:MAG: GNAT family N-acetyltransferase [Clostridiales bacterium]|nr:GNAT family N-acetyltransferase [Clostridiales bacterium]
MLQHKGTITLETERLILRRFALDDAENMFNNWANDSEVTRFLSWPPHENIEVTRTVISSWIQGYENPETYSWAIVLKEINKPIGSIALVSVNSKNLRAEVGYCIGKPYWHKGYTSEAFTRVLEFVFDEVGFNRMEAKHDVRNPHSGGVMKKCGMTFEGTLRQVGLNRNNEFFSCDLYSILRSEWDKKKNTKAIKRSDG